MSNLQLRSPITTEFLAAARVGNFMEGPIKSPVVIPMDMRREAVKDISSKKPSSNEQEVFNGNDYYYDDKTYKKKII